MELGVVAKYDLSDRSSVPIGQMVFSVYTKRRILLLRERGKRTKEISDLLLKEDIRASHRGISKFLSRYVRTSREVQ